MICMQSTFISVIVPIYNVEKYICRCVDSILNQTYKNIEIILVDDGSPDNCPKICDEYAAKDSRIRVVHKKNGGLSDARNAGMAVANGEFISFIDGDDYIDCDMLLDLFGCITEDESDIVSCGVRWVDEDGKVIINDCADTHTVLNDAEAMKELLLDGLLKQHVWNKLYRTSVIRNILFEKGKCNEDVFWSYQAIGNSHRISILPKVHYNYIQRSNSIMGVGYSEKWLDALDANDLRCKYIKKNYPDLYNLSLYTYVGNCMFHLQCALKTNSDDNVKNNIIGRIGIYKNGNIFECISGKQKMWLKMFCKAPVLTCKIRNKIGIGM